MTERELQSAVLECARFFGWRVAHFRPAKTERGWRTPVEADGAGFPDLVLVRAGWLLFIELKATRGRVSVDQEQWLADLDVVAGRMGSPVVVQLWTPDQWIQGWVERVLRDPATAKAKAA